MPLRAPTNNDLADSNKIILKIYLEIEGRVFIDKRVT
jgi:hypothetical protein